MQLQEHTNSAIARELLARGQIVGVIDFSTRLICDLQTRRYEPGGHEHVLVGIDMLESTAFEICSSSIGGTGVGGKERLNTVFFEITF